MPVGHGLNKGERNGQAKLTEHKVRSIRQRRAAGEGVFALAREHRVGPTAIKQAVSGETWGWLE